MRVRFQRECVESSREGDLQDLKVNQDGCPFIETRLHLLYSIIALQFNHKQY